MTATTDVKVLVPGDRDMVALLGRRDELLKLVEAAFAARIVVRGNEITISGPHGEAERVGLLFEELLSLLDAGQELNASAVGRSIQLIKGDRARPSEVLADVVLSNRGRGISPKTLGQKEYVDAMRRSTITFAIGPAGTGKTYLAVATAVRALQAKEVSRIILDELVYGRVLPESVARLQAVAMRLQAHGAQALVLGCTELPLALNDANTPIPTLDSTRLLARAALRRAIET